MKYSKVTEEAQPSSEPPKDRAEQAQDDRATIRAIRGKGFAVTFSSHFAIAIVGAAIAGIYGASHRSIPEADTPAYQKATECVGRLEKLDAVVTQMRNENTMHNGQVDTQLSLLVIRTDILLRKP